jgi:hypothetical protein
MKLRNSFFRYGAIVSLLATGSANAAIDTAAITTAFGDLTTAIGVVGGLIIGAAALAVSYKWVKGMIFG